MSAISTDAKDALARDVLAHEHCREALRRGLAIYGRRRDRFVTHRHAIARLFWSLLPERKAFPIETAAPARLSRPTFTIALPPDLRGNTPRPARKCDRRAELRAAFLASGSLAAGTSGYHLEFGGLRPAAASRLEALLREGGAPPKRTQRAGRSVLYYKDFDAIVAVLTLAGAFGAVLRLEDVRALRETKNRIHRLVNTEAANLERIASSAAAQRRNIAYLQQAYGFSRLTPALAEIAKLRLAHPDESLSQLGQRCAPQISKSTVGGRLSALARLAQRIRAGQGRAEHVR